MRRPQICPQCRTPYRRVNRVSVWVDVTRLADHGGKRTEYRGAECGCGALRALVDALTRRPPAKALGRRQTKRRIA